MTDELIYYQSPEKPMTGRDWLAILGGALGAFMAILDIQVTNASIREISAALSLDMGESGWISSAYLIAEIIVIPLTASLAEITGIKAYLFLNCVGFVLASTLCGLSWSPHSLIFFRVLQGLTGGTLIPMSFQLILRLIPESKKSLGLTLFGLTVTLAPTLGPSLGGWLTDQYGWRSIFFINIFPGVVMAWMVMKGLEPSVPKWANFRRIDVRSFVTLVLGLATLTYMLEEGPRQDWFESNTIRLNFITCLLTLPYFIVRQFSIEFPILKLRLLLDRNFALGTVITTLAGCGLFSGIYSLSLFLGQVKNLTAAQIGQVLMWVGLPQLAVMPFAPYLMRKLDLRLLAILGISLFSYSNWLNTHLSLNSTGDDLIVSLLLRAFGQPLFVIPLSVIAMAPIQKEDSGDASAIFNVMRNLGASLGIALTSTFLLQRQAFYFMVKAEPYSIYDFGLMEKIYKRDLYYRGEGLDAAGASFHAFHDLMRPVLSDSIVSSFNDIFLILTALIALCIVLIASLRKTNANASSHNLSH